MNIDKLIYTDHFTLQTAKRRIPLVEVQEAVRRNNVIRREPGKFHGETKLTFSHVIDGCRLEVAVVIPSREVMTAVYKTPSGSKE